MPIIHLVVVSPCEIMRLIIFIFKSLINLSIQVFVKSVQQEVLTMLELHYPEQPFKNEFVFLVKNYQLSQHVHLVSCLFLRSVMIGKFLRAAFLAAFNLLLFVARLGFSISFNPLKSQLGILLNFSFFYFRGFFVDLLCSSFLFVF
jgi:hypothetical protein